MTVRWGKCFNFKRCGDADSGELVPIPVGSPFVCPQCGAELAPEDAKVPNKRPIVRVKNPENPREVTEIRETSVKIDKAPAKPAQAEPAQSKRPHKRSVLPKFAIAALFLLLVGGAAFLTWGRLNSAKAAGSINADNTILRLAGSNTIGDSMVPSLAEAFLKSQGAADVHVLPGANPQEKVVQGILPGNASPSFIVIAAHGSATAFTAMAESACDIGMASRRIKSDEAAKLEPLGDMTSAGNEHILGLDGIAVIVNASNPNSELHKDEIKRIFAGEITDWSQVGASHGAINVYARSDNSGTYDTFKSLVLDGTPLVVSARRFEDSNALSEAVSGDPNGIGFIGLPFVHNAKPIVISEKGTHGLLPNRLTVATEDYTLSRRLYLYTPSIPRNKFTQLFVEFALSKQGQDLVAADGFVAQSVKPETQEVSKAAPDDYKQLTKNAERLPLDFRFDTDKSGTDNKAQADLDRVVALIADGGGSKDKIMLFGFSDNAGSAEKSKATSLSQAKLIQNQLEQRGIQPKVVRGFGSSLPVASNDTDAGREKNRRVEIWMGN
jgi:phosphate transport system substrate-binding protein